MTLFNLGEPDTQIADLGSLTINGNNTVAFAPGRPAAVKRVIFRYTTGNTTATNGITIQRRPIAGVASNQVSLFTFETTETTAAGDIDFAVLAVANPAGVAHTSQSSSMTTGSQLSFSAEDENFPVIWPGQDLAIVSDGDGTAGVCNVYVEYYELPFNEDANEAQIAAIVQLTVAAA